MRYQITNYELLKQMLAELRDDRSLPWQTYPCLEWPRGRNPMGYGQIGLHGNTVLVHRLSYELSVGPIPEGCDICHHCDNPPCFRGAHLFPGSHLDNMRDMYAKGRRIALRGEEHPGSKLRDEDIPQIQSLYVDGIGQRALAEKFGITKNAIAQVVRGLSWKHAGNCHDIASAVDDARNRKAFGERSGTARLTESQVIRIREMGRCGQTHRAIADLFGVTHTTVRMILLGRTWKHIP